MDRYRNSINVVDVADLVLVAGVLPWSVLLGCGIELALQAQACLVGARDLVDGGGVEYGDHVFVGLCWGFVNFPNLLVGGDLDFLWPVDHRSDIR